MIHIYIYRFVYTLLFAFVCVHTMVDGLTRSVHVRSGIDRHHTDLEPRHNKFTKLVFFVGPDFNLMVLACWCGSVSMPGLFDAPWAEDSNPLLDSEPATCFHRFRHWRAVDLSAAAVVVL